MAFNTPDESYEHYERDAFIKGELYPTNILIDKYTAPGMNLFIRGGNDKCATDEETGQEVCNCEDTDIDVTIRERNEMTWPEYFAWGVGASKLSWCELEGQGSFGSGRFTQDPLGLPAAWTSDDANHPNYEPINQIGDHQWAVMMDMDCSQTVNGEFYFRSILAISGQMDDTENVIHKGKCGQNNVVVFNVQEGNDVATGETEAEAGELV